MRTVRAAAGAAALALGLTAAIPYGASALAAQEEPVDLGGEPVVGSTDSRDAAPIGAGLWSTTLGPDAQHFVYERQIEGSTVHVGVVAAPQTADSDGVQLDAAVTSPESDEPSDCDSDYDSSSSVPQGVVGAHVIVGHQDDDGVCRGASSVAVSVSRYPGSSTGDLPIAIKVVEEAPVAQAEGPPEESLELGYEPPRPVEPADGPLGAPSFEDAPTVDAREGAVTIAAEITEGAQLLWRVPLGWGDQLVVRAEIAALSEADATPLGFPSTPVRLQIVQPDRDTFALTEPDHYFEDTYGSEEAKQLFAATYPLRYANRYADVVPTLPGDHWVSLAAAPTTEERGPLDVPVKLTFAVTRTEAPAPTYKGAVLAQGGGAGPEGYSADTPYLVGNGEFAAVASGNPFAPESDDGSWWGPRRFAGLGLGVVSLACCVAGAVWLGRARRR